MSRCLGEDVQADLLDRAPFKCSHRLLGHPSLELDHLAKVIPTLPAGQVMYSRSLLSNGDDFEGTFRSRPEGVSIEQTFAALRDSDAYIMVSSPQSHPSLRELYQDLIADVEDLMHLRRVGQQAITPKLYLFIASPNSVTPFHIDRYSTFLLQFRGSKTVTVSQPWDQRVVSDPDCESYVAYINTKLPWAPDKDAHSTAFHFNPGEALHIPFVAGHHVRNGPDDVSVSMSIIFNTDQTVAWRNALNFNQRSRRVLGKLGLKPARVGEHPLRDGLKARAWSTYAKLRGI